MDDAPPGALSPARLGTLLDALLASAWWGLFALLLWVCFLREPPRSLALTASWFATPQPALVSAVLVLLVAGTARARRPGRARALGVASVTAGVLTILSWGAARLAA